LSVHLIVLNVINRFWWHFRREGCGTRTVWKLRFSIWFGSYKNLYCL